MTPSKLTASFVIFLFFIVLHSSIIPQSLAARTMPELLLPIPDALRTSRAYVGNPSLRRFAFSRSRNCARSARRGITMPIHSRSPPGPGCRTKSRLSGGGKTSSGNGNP